MAHVRIDIPGNTTSYEDAPEVLVKVLPNEPVSLVLTYHSEPIRDGIASFGVVTFQNVFEYRWMSDSIEYEEFDEHINDYDFGLMEIVNSQYVERIASKGPWREYHHKRFGDVISEEDVKHYRIAFDEHGHFDVIALSVVITSFTRLVE